MTSEEAAAAAPPGAAPAPGPAAGLPERAGRAHHLVEVGAGDAQEGWLRGPVVLLLAKAICANLYAAASRGHPLSATASQRLRRSLTAQEAGSLEGGAATASAAAALLLCRAYELVAARVAAVAEVEATATVVLRRVYALAATKEKPQEKRSEELHLVPVVRTPTRANTSPTGRQKRVAFLLDDEGEPKVLRAPKLEAGVKDPAYEVEAMAQPDDWWPDPSVESRADRRKRLATDMLEDARPRAPSDRPPAEAPALARLRLKVPGD
mmetsp:Transcript_74103/g.224629  ORF Transcript_74103/g.224629 Transcript_74103/m.224629 type:complete len:266 (+) Transcript_74103:1-798(+)